MRIRLAPQARSDLDSIWTYTAQELGGEEVATRLIERITEKFSLFARFPFIGKSLNLERHTEVRTFVAHPYVIFYRPLQSEIRILRVIHASRDALAIFERE